MHWGRRTHLSMMQPRPVRIYGPDSQIVPRAMLVEQLPSDPDLSQIEAFRLYQGSNRAPVLSGPASTTMSGALRGTLELTKTITKELIQVWDIRRRSPALIPQPKECWPVSDRHPSTCFEGYDPGRLPFDPTLLQTGPDLGTQFRTAALTDDLFSRWGSFD